MYFKFEKHVEVLQLKGIYMPLFAFLLCGNVLHNSKQFRSETLDTWIPMMTGVESIPEGLTELIG